MISKQTLKQVIADQASHIQHDHIVTRHKRSAIESFHDSAQITILSGIRRCGKSTILQDVRHRHQPSSHYINFDDERLLQFTVDDFQPLLEVFLELLGEESCLYFDEIQNVDGWERFVRRMHDQGRKLYITGSNANLLSREFGTHLTGRHIPLTIYPFSFTEYCQFSQIDTSALSHTTEDKVRMIVATKSFLQDGGFPYYLKTKERDYLRLLYDDILYRDIITRHNLPNEKPIRELAQFVASNPGKELSFSKLKNMLGLSSPSTVKDYFSYFEQSYLFFILNQYSPSLKKQAYASKKAYIIDTAMADMIGFRSRDDWGGYLENAVFLELKRRGHEIFFYKDHTECDFIIRKGRAITTAIQVCFSLDHPDTRARELEGLQDAITHFSLNNGLLLTLEDEGESDGITIMPVWKWLLEQPETE